MVNPGFLLKYEDFVVTFSKCQDPSIIIPLRWDLSSGSKIKGDIQNCNN